MAAHDEAMQDVERAEPSQTALPIVEDEISWDTFSEDEADEQDTTAEQYAHGKDLQGIPWQNLQFTREHYRTTRIKQYNNYTNVIPQGSTEYRDVIERDSLKVRPDGRFFQLVRNVRSVHAHIVHFQLRNLVWATSRNDVYLVTDNCITHWSPITRRATPVMDLGGPPAAPLLSGVGRMQVSTMCVGEDIIAAGGFNGELAVQRMGCPDMMFCGRISNSDNGITNGLEMVEPGRAGALLVSANNDNKVRIMDLATCKVLATHELPWAVNYTAVRPSAGPGGCIMALVGDDTAAVLLDVASGRKVAELHGHMDYSFAVAWHPDGNLFATGNQDTTSLVWDVRCLRKPLHMLRGEMSAIRSLRWSPDGRFLAMAEPADFVHVFDVQQGFAQAQVVDLFGEVAGVSFTPDSDALFVSVSDMTYASLMQFDRAGGEALVQPEWR